jgi:hypothetical protein
MGKVVSASDVRKLKERVRELEHLLGPKTRDVGILKEALDLERAKTDIAVAIASSGRFPVKTVTTPWQSRARTSSSDRRPRIRGAAPKNRLGDVEFAADIR